MREFINIVEGISKWGLCAAHTKANNLMNNYHDSLEDRDDRMDEEDPKEQINNIYMRLMD